VTPTFPNSATVLARERLVLKGGSWAKRALTVRYGLVRHPTKGVILIDTGYTAETLNAPGRSAALRLYARVLAPRPDPAGEVLAQLAGQGLHQDDIRLVVVTHFHADHVSGARMFRNARFLASRLAFDAVTRRGALANHRHGIFPELLPPDFAERLDALEDCAPARASLDGRDLLGDGSMIGVDLPGHAEGHFGVLFPPLNLLYGVDAQWLSAALAPMRAPGFPASLVPHDRKAWSKSSALVRRFQDQGGKVVLCHDPEDPC
jgi:glyoxylase-like metal-dependent hydrolase (beta-lactamase superfamily II)